VRDEDSGHAAFGGCTQQSHDGFAVDRVQGARRFVGEQEPAVADDSAGDGHPLSLATR
jgi:hypothetical protein